MFFIRKFFIKIFLLFLRKNVHIEQFSYIGRRTHFSNTKKIYFGKGFSCGLGCHFSSSIQGGNNIMIASHVGFVGGDHKFEKIMVPFNQAGKAMNTPIIIEDNVWIGHGAIVLHGVRIGSGSVVAAGAVVVKNVEANSIVGGNPAYLIRMRKV